MVSFGVGGRSGVHHWGTQEAEGAPPSDTVVMEHRPVTLQDWPTSEAGLHVPDPHRPML